MFEHFSSRSLYRPHRLTLQIDHLISSAAVLPTVSVCRWSNTVTVFEALNLVWKPFILIALPFFIQTGALKHIIRVDNNVWLKTYFFFPFKATLQDHSITLSTSIVRLRPVCANKEQINALLPIAHWKFLIDDVQQH